MNKTFLWQLLLSELKTILLVLARCETRIEDQTKLLQQVMATQKDMLHQLLKMQSVSSSSSSQKYDFTAVDDVLPIETLQAFEALEGRLTSDQEFKELMVSKNNFINTLNDVTCSDA